MMYFLWISAKMPALMTMCRSAVEYCRLVEGVETFHSGVCAIFGFAAAISTPKSCHISNVRNSVLLNVKDLTISIGNLS